MKALTVMFTDFLLLVSAVVILLTLAGCSFSSFYPTLGAGLGAGAGSIGGVGGAIGGGMAGAAIGEIATSASQDEHTAATIAALTSGDVEGLVKAQLTEQKSTFDKVIDGIYKTILLCCIGAGLWFLVPILWTKYHVKKTVEKLNGNPK